MESFRTADFNLTKKEFFKIILLSLLKRSWWVFLITPLVYFVIIYYFMNGITFNETILIGTPYVIGLMVFMTILRSISSWLYVNNKKNKAFYIRKYCVFDDNTISTFNEIGETSKINTSSIIRVKKVAGCYMLFVSTVYAIFLPPSAFTSPTELAHFKDFLKLKGLR